MAVYIYIYIYVFIYIYIPSFPAGLWMRMATTMVRCTIHGTATGAMNEGASLTAEKWLVPETRLNMSQMEVSI